MDIEEANGELEEMSESNEISVTERASPTRASRELQDSIAGLEFAIRREGWLYKNHNGEPYAKTHKRRWFLSDGFHVEYFEDEARTRRTGRFDLRNVVGLGASTEVTRGLDFQLSESKSGKVAKTITISFESVTPAEGSAWSTLWASAVKATCLSESVRHLRSQRLAQELDQRCWSQGPCISSVRREMSSASSDLILSPRNPKFTPMRMETMRQKQLAEELARPASTPVKPTRAWLGASPASSGRASTHSTPPPASSSADDDAADGGMDGGMTSPSVSFRSDATSTTTSASCLGRSPSSPSRQPSRLGSFGVSGSGLLSSGGSSFGMGSSVRSLLGRAGERRSSVQMGVISEAGGGAAAGESAGPSLPPAIPLPPTGPSAAAPAPAGPSGDRSPLREHSERSARRGSSAPPPGAPPPLGTPPPPLPSASASHEGAAPPPPSGPPPPPSRRASSRASSSGLSSGGPPPMTGSGRSSISSLQAAIEAADTEEFADALLRTNSDGELTSIDLSRRRASAPYLPPYDGEEGLAEESRLALSLSSSSRRYSDVSAPASGGSSSSSLREGDRARMSMALQMTSGNLLGGRRSSEIVPEMLDEEEQQRALRRYTRPRMGSSTTLAIPLIERHAEDLGAGRLRVAVPDGLEVGEELLALLPDGRRQLIRLPAGEGSKGVGRHLVFFTDMPRMIWQPAVASQPAQ